MIYLVAITEMSGESIRTYRRFSSFPHSSNFVRIPGLSAMKYNSDMFAGQIISKFCPDSFSPSTMRMKAEEQQYQLIHEMGYPSDSCGAWTWFGMGHTTDECFDLARQQGRLAFSFGRPPYMQGGCYSEAIMVDDAFWNAITTDPRHPACPNGYWVPNPYFDTYAMKPGDGYAMTTTGFR